MNIQITDAGVAILNANTGPIVLTAFELGSAYNYTPSPSDTNIHGTVEFSGVPSTPFAANANIVVYSLYLDYSIGTFSFGEIGLFYGGTLFALGSSSSLIQKIAAGVTAGNSLRIDVYLSMVGTNYEMWFDLGNSANSFRLAILESPDLLPQSANAVPNVYVIQAAASNQSSILAYTDRVGLWNFDVYQYDSIGVATIHGYDSMSVTIPIAQYADAMNPDYLGQVLLEFTTGSLYSICRYISGVVISGGYATLSFHTALAITPAVGDTFQVMVRNAQSAAPAVPIASSTTVGGIKVGTDFNIAGDGTLSINGAAAGLVTSVNSQTGDVSVPSESIIGLTTSTTAANQTVDTLLTTAYRGVSYKLAISANSSYQWIEINILHNGTVPTVTMWGYMNTSGSALATFSVSIVGSTLSLLATPANAVTKITGERTVVSV